MRNHPSVALWCGNNENLRALKEWNWQSQFSKKDGDEVWEVYQKIFNNILPEAVKKYHPEIGYWESSPQAAPNKVTDRKSGDEHDWSVWFGDVPFSSYAYEVPRFVSEYGLQAFPEMKTVKAFASESDMAYYRSPIMEHRQRSNMTWIDPNMNGNEMMLNYIKKYYKDPKNFASYAYLSQVMQAEGMKYAVEAHRGNMSRCMGSLYWQINDCWPTMSWASVDYFGRWKASHYFVKNAYKPMLVIPMKKENNLQIVVANDNLQNEPVSIILTLFNFDGSQLWTKEFSSEISANTSKSYFSIPENELLSKGPSDKMVLSARLVKNGKAESENLFYFKDCKELTLEKPEIVKNIVRKGESAFEITLSTNKLAKNVALFTSKTEGFFSENFFDMIPGKEYKIIFTGKAENLKDELEVMCVNESF